MSKNTLPTLAFVALMLASCAGNDTPKNTERIKADQIGYQVNSTKIAIVPDSASSDFEIVDMEGNVVKKGKTSDAEIWKFSGTKVKKADFSDLNKEGIFFVRCNGAINSYPFAIGKGIYQQLSIDAVKSYYYARTGVEITKEFGGRYARPAAHPDTRVIVHKSAEGPKRKAGDIISSPGGWYDAGDYGKYVVNSSISVWEILNAVEVYPEYASSLKLNIPESNNQLPDVVDELLFNLRWMLTMQDPDDGAVYHKLTSLGFNGMVMPHDDFDERYVIGKSTTAALDLAATCAKAYRVLEKYESELPGLRDTLMTVAEKAWNWAQKNPNALFAKNPEGVMTGMYNDVNIRDEFAWAATEMALSTGKSEYLKDIKVEDFAMDCPAWDSVGTLGIISALHIDNANALMGNDLYNGVKNGFIALADKYLDFYEKSQYATPLTYFPWGSNSTAANMGVLLTEAYRATGNTKYLEAAQAALHYILGRNPLDYCYVTGFGSNPVKNPHDRRAVADGIDAPVSGYLCGGPNATAYGDILDSEYPSTAPAMRYKDTDRSYTTNEIAINWNAALIGLVFAVDSE